MNKPSCHFVVAVSLVFIFWCPALASATIFQDEHSAQDGQVENLPSDSLLSAPVIRFPDFGAIRQSVSENQFFTTEKALLAILSNTTLSNTISDEDLYPYTALAQFYIAHGFYEEALAYLEMLPLDDQKNTSNFDLAIGLRTLSQYKAGRYRDIADNDSNLKSQLREPFLAMAASRLGKYEDALAVFKRVGSSVTLPFDLEPEYLLLHADSAIQMGQFNQARQSLSAIPLGSLNQSNRDFGRFLTAQIKLHDLYKDSANHKSQIRDTLERLESLAMPWGGETEIDRILLDVEEGLSTPEEAQLAIEKVGLKWSGGNFERKLRYTRAALSRKIGDKLNAFSMYRDVIMFAPDTLYAEQATNALQEMMVALFAQEDDTPVLQATQLFYDNIDLLAPGALGDEQIRKATKRLEELDLLEEAAELLEHQVFHRLRGIERSVVAANLAKIYLEDRKPDEALRVIRSTRITGLSEEIRASRRAIEATALWKSGQHDKAIARLDLAGGQELPEETIYLRGMIELDMGDVNRAGETLFGVVRNRLHKKELDRDDQALILHTISAYVRSGDQVRLQTIESLMQANFNDHPVTNMIAALADGAAPEKFLREYRLWLVDNQQSIDSTGI